MTGASRRAAAAAGTGGRPPVSHLHMNSWPARVAVAMTCAFVVTGSVTARQVFRSAAGAIAIDVQVVDRDGNPISALTAEQFQVEIAGKARPVRLVNFIAAPSSASTAALPSAAPIAAPPAVGEQHADALPATDPRQTFVLAVDAQTFSPAVSRGIAETAQRFVRTLAPSDRVGLYSYPLGPKVEPTTDRDALVKALDQLSGQREVAPASTFTIRNADLVDYFADRSGRSDNVSAKYCPPGSDMDCSVRLRMEMTTRAGLFEAQAQADLGMLRGLVERLGALVGRTVLVLVSAGLPISDRPGGRPDVANLPLEVGEACARSNVTIYTLFVDNSLLDRFSAEVRSAQKTSDNQARDTDLAERWLDQFSGAGGGSLVKVLTNNTEAAFGRIARETSAYYLLGVDATDADRTGRAQPIKVRVAAKGATVRSRAWVVVPKAATP